MQNIVEAIACEQQQQQQQRTCQFSSVHLFFAMADDAPPPAPAPFVCETINRHCHDDVAAAVEFVDFFPKEIVKGVCEPPRILPIL